MTPSLGVTPDEAQLPEGPPAHRGGHIWAVPILWAWLSGEQILGLDLPREWVLGLDLSLGGLLSFPLSFSPVAVNISKKWKRQKKKKERKSHHLKPPGACGPASRAPPGRATPLGPGSPDFSVCVCIPSRVAAARAAFYNPETEKPRSNSETKNLFPSRHLFLLPPSLLRLTLAPVSPPGARTSLPVPGPGSCPPSLPTGPGEAPSHPKMLLPRWLCCPFEFLPLVYCFWNSGLGVRG